MRSTMASAMSPPDAVIVSGQFTKARQFDPSKTYRIGLSGLICDWVVGSVVGLSEASVVAVCAGEPIAYSVLRSRSLARASILARFGKLGPVELPCGQSSIHSPLLSSTAAV